MTTIRIQQKRVITMKQADKRDRRLLHKVRVKAENALARAAHGHNDGWQALQDALDKCDDEMGTSEDFEL